MTRITDTLVLPPDVDLTPVTALSPTVRAAIGAADSDWAVTRPGSRTPSRVIDADLADLLELFRDGSTIADAVANYSFARSADAADVLAAALPSLEAFISSHWLVRAGEPRSAAIGQTLAIGTDVDGLEVLDCRRVVEDSELYLARDAEWAPLGAEAAARRASLPPSARAGGRCAAPGRRRPGSCRSLRGDSRRSPVPRHRMARRRRKSCACHRASGARRRAGRPCRPLRRRRAAYAELHERGVLHGDVHPGNVLVAADGSVGLVDFGLACSIDSGAAHHGGVAYYFDPQHAGRPSSGGMGVVRSAPSPSSTPSSRRWCTSSSPGAITTTSGGRIAALQQIANNTLSNWRPRCLRTCRGGGDAGLSHSPNDRHASMRAFADALARSARHPAAQRVPRPRSEPPNGDEFVARQLDWLRAGGPDAVENAPGPHGSIMSGRRASRSGFFAWPAPR